MSEIVITCGLPASGKTSLAQDYIKRGYLRLNRDELGGTLAGIAKRLSESLEARQQNFILDNTYINKAFRAEVIKVGRTFGVPVRCLWVKTSLEVCQFNAAHRLIKRYGHLLTPEEIKQAGKEDPNCFLPGVLYGFKKSFEPPSIDEGFASIEESEYIRVWGPEYQQRALLLDFDGTLRDTKSGNKYPTTPEDVEVLPGRYEKLLHYKQQGYLILGVSNQSGIAKGILSTEAAQACFAETNKQLNGIIQDYRFCPHQSHPITCYCRKPSSGWGAELIEFYKLNPSECLMVGDMTTDETFAKRSGFQYLDVKEFFK